MAEQIQITSKDIEKFIEGEDPFEGVVNLSYKSTDDFMTVYYRNKNDKKCMTKMPFKPFIWATRDACLRLCNGNRYEVKYLLDKYKIGVKRLRTTDYNGVERPEFEDGYIFQFYAKVAMPYRNFMSFFKAAGNPIYANRDKDGNEVVRSASESRQYLVVPPQEQFMISRGLRFFKGFDDYDQLLRMAIDLETTSLDPRKGRITHIGIRTNRGYEKVLKVKGETPEELRDSEIKAIDEFLHIIAKTKPDIITAHNGENFDWYFTIVRCEELGTTMEEMSSKVFNGETIHKDERESILKLGGEIEKYRATKIPTVIVTDSLHAVRRAQATDSNFLKADLKYATDYLGMKKPNRVYIKGDMISKTLLDKEHDYAFNDADGKWYMITEKNPLKEGYQVVTGEYIVDRYLLDDIWECDKVEYKLNTTNFLICKLLPIPYAKCTTMGTAGQWKGLMMGWSYKNNLAIPMFRDKKPFTGGLSRLLKTGFVDRVIKLDYNSLYPSIILTWAIADWSDLMGVMLKMLEYVLTTRENFKGFKKAANKIIDMLEPMVMGDKAKMEDIQKYRAALGDYEFNDKKQGQMKVFGNSYFGSYGAPNVFPWSSLKCAEQTTCTGRQCLRLMVHHFAELGYTPIVGDSVTPDTPLFIKYKDTGLIDIIPISDVINEDNVSTDALGREYDYSEKPYQVLCRSGWSDVKYVYRHKTDKEIYRITNEDGSYIDVTKDHSLFDKDKNEIKPIDINKDTELEFYDGKIYGDKKTNTLLIGESLYTSFALLLATGKIDRVPMKVLNSDIDDMKVFYSSFMNHQRDDIQYSKTTLAGLRYLRNIVGK